MYAKEVPFSKDQKIHSRGKIQNYIVIENVNKFPLKYSFSANMTKSSTKYLQNFDLTRFLSIKSVKRNVTKYI